ncbi:hypothetical protein HDZ31DRAFT_83989 [Schizophyllum fasciatum]
MVDITIPLIHDTAITLYTIAAAVTVCRLLIRVRDRKWGIDDFWALLAMITGGLMLTGALIIITPTPSMTQLTKVAGYYLCACGFYSCIWCCRFSILCTISRIAPQSWTLALRIMFASFAAMWVFLMIQALVHCESDPSWHSTGQCALGQPVAIAQLITDIIADLMLGLAPIRLLWQSHLTKAQRMRLIVVFAACLLTTLVSLAHAYCIISGRAFDEIYAAMFELSVSIIVCSLSVIVGFFSRKGRHATNTTSNDRHGGTHGTGIELSVNARPINVDITTSTWVDGENGAKQMPDAEENRDMDYKSKDHMHAV